MRRSALKLLVTAVAIIAFGFLRAPMEDSLTREFRAQHLLLAPLDLGTQEKLGQTARAVALGGMRTLLAAFWNLRAYGYFEEQDWFRLEETYRAMVALAPQTRYYWDSYGWHLAYNAAVYYANDDSVPPLRRRQMWHDAIMRGQAVLEDGIRNNPDDWLLAHRLGRLLDDPNKLQDPARAAEWFAYSAERGAPAYVRRNQLYALGRVPGREEEALALARRLFADRSNRVPSLNCLTFALEVHAGGDPEVLVGRIFPDRRQAFEELSMFLRRANEGYPQDGVRQVLLTMTRELGADPAKRTPLVNCLRFVLEAGSGWEPVGLSKQLFASPREAFDQLSAFWGSTGRVYPQDGIAAALLPLCRELYADPAQRSPQLAGLRFVLEIRAGGDPAALVGSLFASPREALQQLGEYRRTALGGWPRDGVDATLRRLERELHIPAEKSVFSE